MSPGGLALGDSPAALLGLSGSGAGWLVALALPLVFVVGIAFVYLAERDR